MKSARRHRIALGAAVAAAAGAGLMAVFYLYSRPDFLVQLSNQIWACF